MGFIGRKEPRFKNGICGDEREPEKDFIGHAISNRSGIRVEKHFIGGESAYMKSTVAKKITRKNVNTRACMNSTENGMLCNLVRMFTKYS